MCCGPLESVVESCPKTLAITMERTSGQLQRKSQRKPTTVTGHYGSCVWKLQCMRYCECWLLSTSFQSLVIISIMAATHDCCLGKLLYIMPSQSNEIGRNGSLMNSVFVFSTCSKYSGAEMLGLS